MNAGQFDLPTDVIYLNTAGAGPRLRCVNAAAQQALADSAAPWRAASDAWIAQTEHLRALAAALFGTTADALAYAPSVSYGMAVAAHNLPLRRGDNVVVLAQEYPSNRAVWQVRAAAVDAQVRHAAPGADGDRTAAVLALLDARTAVVSLPHCHWTDGSRLDLLRIGAAARDCGAALVIDASQSLGVLELDFDALRPDFVVSPGHKWLLGAYGLGWLWAAPRWRAQGEPIEQSFLAREAGGDFAALDAGLPPYRAGARRYDFGPYPHPLSVPMSIAALEQLRQWGIARVAARLGALQQHLRRALQDRGITLLPAAGCSPHLCALRPAPEALPRVLEALRAARIVVAQRAGALRIAPHLHVDTAQLDRFVEVLAHNL